MRRAAVTATRRGLSAIPNTLAYSFSLTPQGDGSVVALQDNGAGTSLERGRQWRYLRGTSEGGEAVVDPFDPSRCYFAHPDSGLRVSFDGCRNFSKARVAGIESLAFDPSHSDTVYAVTHADRPTARISISNDGGKTWNAASWRFTNPYQIVISPSELRIRCSWRPAAQRVRRASIIRTTAAAAGTKLLDFRAHRFRECGRFISPRIGSSLHSIHSGRRRSSSRITNRKRTTSSSIAASTAARRFRTSASSTSRRRNAHGPTYAA